MCEFLNASFCTKIIQFCMVGKIANIGWNFSQLQLENFLKEPSYIGKNGIFGRGPYLGYGDSRARVLLVNIVVVFLHRSCLLLPRDTLQINRNHRIGISKDEPAFLWL
jgi:hypothetical protein